MSSRTERGLEPSLTSKDTSKGVDCSLTIQATYMIKPALNFNPIGQSPLLAFLQSGPTYQLPSIKRPMSYSDCERVKKKKNLSLRRAEHIKELFP